MLKQLSSTIVISTLLAGSAFAADLPSIKSASVAAPAPMWAGFYAGLNVGYGFGSSNGTHTSSFPVLDNWDNAQRTGASSPFLSAFDNSYGILFANNGSAMMTQNGIIGGGQLGYNLQLMDKYVVGFETDFQGSGITGSGQSYGIGKGELDFTRQSGSSVDWYGRDVYGTNYINASLNWLGTARLRAGYLIMPTLLGYATGGLSYGGITASASPAALTSYHSDQASKRYYGTLGSLGFQGNADSLAVGWNAGGGFEWMFSQNWSVKTEAIYYSLGSQTLTSYTYQPANIFQIGASKVYTGDWMTQNKNTISYNGIILRAGVNYHFNFASAPVVAKF